jgi:magnesium chelatase subunit I
LVYEGEQEGQYNVAIKLLNEAIKKIFLQHFPHPEKYDKRKGKDPYGVIKAYFNGGNVSNLMMNASKDEFESELTKVAGLSNIVKDTIKDVDEAYIYMELLLHGLVEFQVLNKTLVEEGIEFSDPLGGLLDDDIDELNN